MTNDNSFGPAIAKHQLKALRTADSISFHTFADGRSFLTAHKRLIDGVWQATTEATLEVSAGVRWTNYNEPMSENPGPFNSAYTSESMGNEKLETIFKLMHHGDELRLHWVIDNYSGPLKDEGWHADELVLEVRRVNQVMSFSVRFEVTKDSPARMVRIMPIESADTEDVDLLVDALKPAA